MRNSHQDWQTALANAITDPIELCETLELDNQKFQVLLKNSGHFSLRVPRSFVNRMEKSNWQDPLLLQILPLVKETQSIPGYSSDPLQEKRYNPVPGLLHKYHGRVLLIAAGGCPIHCRYCFRRHFPYDENTPSLSGWEPALKYIQSNTEIFEVILSGGDPLILKDFILKQLIERLAAIEHVKILRIHSRIPVVLPERITEDLIDLLKNSRLQNTMVIHCNHPKEIDSSVQEALLKLRQAGIVILNQFVLLKGINDNAATLIDLSQRLFEYGVLPYYLHLLDPVQGAAHFAVDIHEAQDLIQQIRTQLPGYLVPRLVQEIPGELSKTPLR